MILAAIGDTPYNIILLLHILTALVAFAPVFTHPVLQRQFAGALSSDRSESLVVAMTVNSRRLYSPCLIVTGLLGFALAGMSDKVYSMSDAWLLTAAVIWVLMNGVLHAMIIPGLKALGAGTPAGNGPSRAVAAGLARIQRGTLLMSLMVVVQLWLMIWKPGA